MPTFDIRSRAATTLLAVTVIGCALLPSHLAHAQLAAPASKPILPKKPASAGDGATPASTPAASPTANPPANAPTEAPADTPSSSPAPAPSTPGPDAGGRVGTPIDQVGMGEVAEPDSVLTISVHFTRMRPLDSPPLDNMMDRGLEQLGRLLYSKVDLEVEDQPLGRVLREMRRALGLNMVAFTASNGLDGIDPDRMVTVHLAGVSGREALEALASVAGPGVTWQIHTAVVEFGPKRVLARPEARFTRVYDAGDLAHQTPDYRPGEARGKSYNRRDSDEVLAELVRNIATHCEPEAFLPAPPTMVETPDGKLVPVQHTAPKPSTRSNNGNGLYKSTRKNPNTTATFNFDPSEAAVYIIGQWASVQTQENALTVIAPDFVHRAIDGYEQAIPPRADGPRDPREAAPRQTGAAKPARTTRPSAPRTVTTDGVF